MELMLDTNICIYLIREHPPSVLERFASHAVGDIGLDVRLIPGNVREFGRVPGLRIDDWA